MLEPSARNSNLLPVNANGLVRLRSPPCIGNGGSTGVPRPRNDSGVDSPTPTALDRSEDLLQLGAAEDQTCGWRRFVRAQAVVLAGRAIDARRKPW